MLSSSPAHAVVDNDDDATLTRTATSTQKGVTGKVWKQISRQTKPSPTKPCLVARGVPEMDYHNGWLICFSDELSQLIGNVSNI